MFKKWLVFALITNICNISAMEIDMQEAANNFQINNSDSKKKARQIADKLLEDYNPASGISSNINRQLYEQYNNRTIDLSNKSGASEINGLEAVTSYEYIIAAIVSKLLKDRNNSEVNDDLSDIIINFGDMEISSNIKKIVETYNMMYAERYALSIDQLENRLVLARI